MIAAPATFQPARSLPAYSNPVVKEAPPGAPDSTVMQVEDTDSMGRAERLSRLSHGIHPKDPRRGGSRVGWLRRAAAMSEPTIYTPGPTEQTVTAPDGCVLTPPAHWALLRPGDPGLTRRVKATGEFWAVQEKKGRKLFSRGLWADGAVIERLRRELDAERSTDGYQKRQQSAARRREKAQSEYVEDFHGAVLAFLAFDACYADQAQQLAHLVTVHATPVGSGTVARTERIPVEQRAEAAVIAWMRHQTTAYDHMAIPRVKGQRREVRRQLARHSHALLDTYRRGLPVPASCPLQSALAPS